MQKHTTRQLNGSESNVFRHSWSFQTKVAIKWLKLILIFSEKLNAIKGKPTTFLSYDDGCHMMSFVNGKKVARTEISELLVFVIDRLHIKVNFWKFLDVCHTNFFPDLQCSQKLVFLFYNYGNKWIYSFFIFLSSFLNFFIGYMIFCMELSFLA